MGSDNCHDMKSKWLTLIAVVLCSFVLTAQQEQRNSQDNAAIVSKLSEVVKIRERLLEGHKRMLEKGVASGTEMVEIELAEARVALANEQGVKATTLTELKALVAAHEARLKRIRAASESGRSPYGELDRAQAALLEVEVRLLRAQR
jgi:hypothetical protein